MPPKRKSPRKRSKSRKRSPSKSKYERCVLKVKAKQPARCARQDYKGPGCRNPWAICSVSVYGKNRKPVRKDSKGRKIYRGPQGGEYYLRQGKKVYV